MKNILKKLSTITLSVMIIITMFNVSLLLAEDTVAPTTTEPSTTNIDGLETKKTAEYDPVTKDYKITLEAYTKGTLSVETKSQPLDIVFVSDQSGSMLWDFAGNEQDVPNEKKRVELLKKSANSVLEKLNKDAIDRNVDHKAAFINFGFKNEAVISLDGEYSSGPWDNARTQEKALINIRTDIKLAQATLNKNLGAPDTAANTYSSYGLMGAQGILSKSKSENSKKVVIFFTDGIDSELDNDTREHASITAAKAMKDAGATVFSVSIPAGLKEDTKLVSPETVRNFQNYISSNYPSATDMKNSGEIIDNPLYMYQATSEVDLGNVFDTIFEIITKPSVELKNVTLKDYMSDYFETPNSDEVKVYKQAYNGNNTWGERTPLSTVDGVGVSINNASKEISVDGFDYNKNFITEPVSGPEGLIPASGSKLVVEFHTDKIDGFIGGNNVPTNTANAGIYGDGKLVENFEVPKVNVPINFGLSTTPQSIYIGGEPLNFQNMFDHDAREAGIQFINEDHHQTTVDGIVNKFVDLKYEIKDDKGNLMTTFIIPAGSKDGSFNELSKLAGLVENTKVNVSVSVLDKGTNDIMKRENGSNANYEQESMIYVFTPTVNVVDQVIFLGESMNLGNAVSKEVDWSCNVPAINKPIGDAPVLNYTYYPNSQSFPQTDFVGYKPKENQSVKMKIYNTKSGKEITEYTKVVNSVNHDNSDFIVQVVKGELDIEAVIIEQFTSNSDLRSAQSFKLKIDARDEVNGEIRSTYYTTIEFSANEGKIFINKALKGLSKGYYTISVVEDWSWKYLEDKTTRYDNYIGNGTVSGVSENTNLYVGEKITDGKYYGAETGTIINGTDASYPAEARVVNLISIENVLGDVATAINKFVETSK